MKNSLTLAASMAVLSGQLLITGCSSDDDSSGGGAAVPANATVIDSSNAVPIVTSVTGATTTLSTALGAEAMQTVTLEDALDIIKPMVKNRLKDSGIDLVTGVAFNESYNCTYGGTYSASGDEIDNDPTYSGTFTATFSNCSEVSGMIIDGTISGSYTENYATGAYTDSITGSISVTVIVNTDTTKISFTGLNFNESGNSNAGTYTTTTATFAFAIAVNGTTQFAFLSQLNADIVESSGSPCPESGHIMITGGNGTTAEGIYNNDGLTMTIKANGTVVDPAYDCTI